MADRSPAIANEFIKLSGVSGLTQMQLQKLVYIAHGWNLAISGAPLTVDQPQAWDYGPVYPDLWRALRAHGRQAVQQLIKVRDFIPFADPESVATAALTDAERELVARVHSDYSKFPAFQLSALTHQDGTPWTKVYAGGAGKGGEISPELIRDHFVHLARTRQVA